MSGTHCETDLPEIEGTQPDRGSQVAATGIDESGRAQSVSTSGGVIGYSPRIHDPAFAGYLSQSGRQAAVFSFILAAIALVGFGLAGALPGSSMRNPNALLIGLAIGGMFMIIALKQIQSSNRTRTWDGRVVDKRIEVRRGDGGGGGQAAGADNMHRIYTVVFLSDSGRTRQLRSEDDGTRYDYFSVGDRVRYHGGLDSFEKYDKSRDSIIFCNACGAVQPITSDYCSRCKYPLLK